MEDIPYRVERRKKALETSLFSVFTDRLVDADGNLIAPDYLVVAPKSRTLLGTTGIVVVPFVGDKVGLLRVHRHAIGAVGWEVPRGFVDDGETPVDAALRELEEEAGLVCNPSDIIDMGCVAPDPGILDARIHCFAARACMCKGTREKEFGHREFQLFTQTEIKQLILGGDIQDSVSLSAYSFVSIIPSISGQDN